MGMGSTELAQVWWTSGLVVLIFFLGDGFSGAGRYNISHKRPLCTYPNGLGGGILF